MDQASSSNIYDVVLYDTDLVHNKSEQCEYYNWQVVHLNTP